MIRLLLIFCLLSGSLVAGAQSKPSSARELIQKMFTTYRDTWYKRLTFSQQIEYFKNGVKEREETWHEAMDLDKGSLVIKFHSMNSGDGIIFRNDSMLVFSQGKLTAKKFKVHELIVLGSSVYFDAPELTLDKLRKAGFNTDYFARETYNGKPHYVVGDPAGAQFWIDEEKLLFIKMTRKLPDGRISEIEFKDYQKLGKAWLEMEVVFTTDGKLTAREVYSNIQVPEKLPESLFSNQSDFTKITW